MAEDYRKILEKEVKWYKRELSIEKGMIYVLGVCTIVAGGVGIYGLIEGNHELALFEGIAMIMTGSGAFNGRHNIRKIQDNLTRRQSYLEKIVTEEKNNQ